MKDGRKDGAQNGGVALVGGAEEIFWHLIWCLLTLYADT